MKHYINVDVNTISFQYENEGFNLVIDTEGNGLIKIGISVDDLKEILTKFPEYHTLKYLRLRIDEGATKVIGIAHITKDIEFSFDDDT